MADERYYQAKREREAYLRTVPEWRRAGWATSSVNARVHTARDCSGLGRKAETFAVDARYILAHRLRACGFCNRAPGIALPPPSAWENAIRWM